jgi:prepilin-type N-terminal cleavage/methylation domain-containing protein
MNNFIKNGFTLIETMVAIAIFTLLWGLISEFIIIVYKTHGYSMDQTIAVGEARRGVDAMAKEIRQARYADNGTYPIVKCNGKEFIFYSDIDNDGAVERVRYFLAVIQSGTQTGSCTSPVGIDGGLCSVPFTSFLTTGTLKSAQVKVSTYGRYGNPPYRYSVFRADGNVLASNICIAPGDNCTACASPWTVSWQGLQTFDVTAYATDNSITFALDGSDGNNGVRAVCGPNGSKYALKANFDFSWTEEIMNADNQLKKGVIQPVGTPATYPLANEQITSVSSFVRNAPPVFTYYDGNGALIPENDAAILTKTKSVKLDMIVDVNPNMSPNSYELQQMVQMRNLKNE